jgi:hypothetical protein
MSIKILSMLLALSLSQNVCVQAQDNEGYAAEREAAMTFALHHLSDRDAIVRQRAAEVLAKFSAVEHQRLVEGYRLQEKNDRVRLALDWALYRMGKTDALYGVVRGLRSDDRRPQAVGYLSQLAGPQPLYLFFDRADGKTVLGLLQVMANIGDAESLELVKPFEESVEPGVSDAARFAMKEITVRLAQRPQDTPARPRDVQTNNKVGP